MKRLYAVVIGLCLMLCSSFVFAQDHQTVDLRIPYFAQRQSTWSWAAVTQMLIKYYDQHATLKQCEYLERLYHVAPNTYCGNESAIFMADMDLEYIQNILAFNGKVHAQSINIIDASEMRQLLEWGKPIIVKVRESYTSTRAILVRGMRWRAETYQPDYGPAITNLIPYVIVNDPAIKQGPLEVPYSQLRASWIGALAVMSTDDGELDGTCGVLNQVISTLPKMESIIGDLDFGDGDIADYGARVRLPGGFTSCVVTIDQSGSWPTFTFKCDVESSDRDCSQVFAVIRDELDEVRGCFPGQKIKTTKTGKAFEIMHEISIPSVGTKISMVVRQTSTPRGKCIGALFLSAD